ncbi:uncharacterized protein METZ01_LOCUS470167, partial [marine metagenome]
WCCARGTPWWRGLRSRCQSSPSRARRATPRCWWRFGTFCCASNSGFPRA